MLGQILSIQLNCVSVSLYSLNWLMINKAGRFLSMFDLFSCLPTLRAKAEPEINNSCGGFLSIIALIFVGYLFFVLFLDVINLNKISYVQNQVNNKENINLEGFMVGIGIEGFNREEMYSYVRFEFQEYTMRGANFLGFRKLESEPCTQQHWKSATNNLSKDYSGLNLDKKICLKMGQNFSIQESSAGQYKLLSVKLNNCNLLNFDDTPVYSGCMRRDIVQKNNIDYIKQFKYFTVLAVFPNTDFKPNQETPTIKYLDVIRSTFTLYRGTQTIVKLSPYKIETDINLFPFETLITQNGFTLDTQQAVSFEATNYNQNINIFFTQSSRKIQITRKVGKIDQMLSYAGGLFGIVMSIFSFFMFNFNQYRYQLLVAEGAFNYSDDGNKVKEDQFHFGYYLQYSLYYWIQTLTCCKLNWQKCNKIQQTKQQAKEQLDVTLLFKKIQHFQKVIQYLITDRQNICLYLTQPPTLQEVTRTRRMAEYYQKIILGKSATTVQDIQMIDSIFQNAIAGCQNNVNQNTNEIFLASSTSKRKLFEEPQKSRENILDFVIHNYKLDGDLFDVVLGQEDRKIQEEMAEAFFRMDDVARRKIQEKIPVKIIQRFKKIFQSKISQESLAINLEI